MWVAKISFDSEHMTMGSKAMKNKVNFLVFPVSWEYKAKKIFVNFAGTLEGEEKDKENFFRDLKKQSNFTKVEKKRDFLIGTVIEPFWSKTIYNKNIFYLEPVVIGEAGEEIITVGSFDKKHIDNLIKTMEKRRRTILHYLKQKKVENVSVVKTSPKLTSRQKFAIELAIKNGYYKVPRKTSVQELAKLANLSFATFQVHLRKAEEKLIPYSFK
ncbi:hypothetical protein HN832_03005 [archaeon]|jgi:predicted DNA binding protein|nr:hypothetical protein [archaeon]MBT4373323.1 hypothetical protein [archaeon]MBT4531668.1 hypothetical protein [archaeon]MBT7001154.1 hypothetical protein [archaeon]MBT7282360.1 hypothetical protein [archaeon]